MKKRAIALLTAAVLVVGLASCGKPADNATGGVAKKDFKADVFYYNFSDAYISSVRTATGKFLSAEGIKFDNKDGNSNQTTQTEQVTTAIAGGTNCLVVNICETKSDDAAMNIVNEAKKNKLPVIFFNREVSDAVVNSYDKVAFVGTEAAEAGHLQGKMIGDYVVANFDKIDLNGDGKISYIMFKGQEGNAEAEMRTKYGVEDADKIITAAGKPALEYYDAKATKKYLVDQEGKWSPKASNDYMVTILSEYNVANKNMPELIIANNDGMALGAISALNTIGFNTGDETKTIPVYGVDATADAQELIKAKKMTGTVLQDHEGMAKTIAMIVKNFQEGKDMKTGTEKMNIDKKAFKIRVPYQPFTGK